MEKSNSVFKIIFDIFSWFFLGTIILVALFTIGSNSNILKGYHSFLVQSGSMEPTIMTGDIVIVHQQNQYLKNDVIAFYGAENRIITHRIISSEKDYQAIFATKGDANRSVDSDTTTIDKIIGKVIFVVPKLGYFVAFAKSLPGLILLIIVPAAALILDELIKIKNG